MESRVRTVATLAEAGEFALFPLDANKLHIIAGALRIAGLYLDAVIWHQENQMHIPVSAALRRAAKTLTKAALRGLPGSRLKQAFDLHKLAQLVAAGFQTRFVDEYGRSRLIFGSRGPRGRRHLASWRSFRRGHHSAPRQMGVDGTC